MEKNKWYILNNINDEPNNFIIKANMYIFNELLAIGMSLCNTAPPDTDFAIKP